MKKIALSLVLSLFWGYNYAQQNYDVIKNTTVGASTATVLSQDDIPITQDTYKIVAVIVQILALILPFLKKKQPTTQQN